jgi:hypothetical protein
MDAPVFPGCVVPSRLVGVIEAEQTEDGKTERNDRLLAVAANSAAHRSIHELRDLTDDREAAVVRMVINKVNYWEPPRSRVRRSFQAVKAVVTRQAVETPMRTIDPW